MIEHDERENLSVTLRRLHEGAIGLPTAIEQIMQMMERGLGINSVLTLVNAQVRQRSDERKRAAQRQLDLMAIHSFVQGVERARRNGGGV